MKVALRTIGLGILYNLTLVSLAFAGASGSPPAGDQGGGASEPSSFALMMICAIPGFLLIRKALRTNLTED